MEDFNPSDNPSVSTKSLDPARKYEKQDGNNKNNWYCDFCGVRTTGGVFQLKQHLAGGHRNTLGCQKVPEHVRKEIQDYMEHKKNSKHTYNMSRRIHQ